MIQLPQIPAGCYCYNNEGCCPHWRRKDNWVYCEHLKVATEVATEPEPTVPHDEGYAYEPMSLIWDQVKECGVNDEDPDED